jgi:hypothetical protein
MYEMQIWFYVFWSIINYSSIFIGQVTVMYWSQKLKGMAGNYYLLYYFCVKRCTPIFYEKMKNCLLNNEKKKSETYHI